MSNDAQPEIRFPGFTDDWEQRKLGEVADIIGGGTPNTNNPEYWNGDIDWYAPAEIGKQIYVKNSQKKISQLGLQKSSAKILPIGTVLFTSRAGIGNTAILAKEGTTNQGFQSIVPHENKLDSYFIFSRTHELKRYGEVTGAGSTFAEVSGKQMAKMPILIPYIDEQQKIGIFFKKLDDTITLHQRKLDLLKETKKGFLQKMFPKNGAKVPEIRFPGFTEDWEQRKLGDLTTWTKGQGLTKEDLNKERDGSEAVHYADLYKFSPVMHEVIHWTNSDDGRIIPDNSLLFPASDVTPVGLARTSTLRLSRVKAGGDVIIGQLNESINSSFMSYQINANSKKILPLITGTTVKHIQAKSLATVSVSITNMAEQTAIAGIFEQLDDTITLHQRKLDLLKETKKGFLQKMFV
ncbi:restriction endonuclease subunit S [Enterococcus faecium]|nr:restriction endonuclease subunit S [Enterococcus faecium]